MSDYIPFDIHSDIINRLPVKSLVRFRSLSKQWKSLISSSGFIARYSGLQDHLLVWYQGEDEDDVWRNFPPAELPEYTSIVDDDTFPQKRVSLNSHLLVNRLKDSVITGCSHGLVCLYGGYQAGSDGPISGTGGAVIWNPSIRKAVAVAVPNVADKTIYVTVLGFGVCSNTNDPKILKITYISRCVDIESIPDSIPYQVEVFRLSTGAWGTPFSSNFPRKSIELFGSQAVMDGVHYWIAIDRISMDAGSEFVYMIISFDLTSEEFREVKLPNNLAYSWSKNYLYISKLRESLVVLEGDVYEMLCVVWLMEDGLPKSFTKLFTIYTPEALTLIVQEFRKSGEPIIEIRDPSDGSSLLGVYDPYTEHINSLGIDGTGAFSVHSYKETLVLLDQADFMFYDKGKHYIANPRGKKRRFLKHTKRV